ncbi:hypothetical protein SKAU_G00279690 [Synaphobranchus kaupii]|uniref:HAT C-terminal dimerisation domain-containing protein n=1 Tax=Synaphobranchus kaupii TaxID=118154 RepID=A0A9Q1INW6_SYNKA|nr:hypothetical protein SKAU_G00279690 [Synaphobranchus kaupii]
MYDEMSLETINKLNLMELHRYYAATFPSIVAVFDLLATLPAASAEVERRFSQMKLVKTDHRSTLTEKHLNDLMAVKMLSPEIGNFDPTRAIEMWNRDGKRCKRPNQKDRTRKKPATAVVEVHAAQPDVVTAEPQEERPGAEAAAAEDSDIDSGEDDSDSEIGSDLAEEDIDRLTNTLWK